jgi:hypothetical protein
MQCCDAGPVPPTCAARGVPPTPVEGSWHDFPLVHACSWEWLSERCRGEKSS